MFTIIFLILKLTKTVSWSWWWIVLALLLDGGFFGRIL